MLLSIFNEGPELMEVLDAQLQLETARNNIRKQLKIADRITSLDKRHPAYGTALLRLAEIYSSIGDYKNSSKNAFRFSRLYPEDPRASDAMYIAANDNLAVGKKEASAFLFYSLAERYPKSKWAAEAAIKSGYLYKEQASPQKSLAAFDMFLKLPGKKQDVDIIAAQSNVLILREKIKTGLEPEAAKLCQQIGALSFRKRKAMKDDLAIHLLTIVRDKVDQEVEFSTIENGIKKAIASKKKRIAAIEKTVTFIKATKNKEFILATDFELGRMWQEWAKALEEYSHSEKKNKALTREISLAKTKADVHLNRSMSFVDSSDAFYASNKDLYEKLAEYYPDKFDNEDISYLEPLHTQHSLEVDLWKQE